MYSFQPIDLFFNLKAANKLNRLKIQFAAQQHGCILAAAPNGFLSCRSVFKFCWEKKKWLSLTQRYSLLSLDC